MRGDALMMSSPKGPPPQCANFVVRFDTGNDAKTLVPMSTRMLIVLALLCGLAILVAFAIQVVLAR